jgi:hypothetical protein
MPVSIFAQDCCCGARERKSPSNEWSTQVVEFDANKRSSGPFASSGACHNLQNAQTHHKQTSFDWIFPRLSVEASKASSPTVISGMIHEITHSNGNTKGNVCGLIRHR